MKLKKKLLLILLSFSVGCDMITESFTDGYNDNPNDPTYVSGDIVFRSGSVAMSLFMNDFAARHAGLHSNHYSYMERGYGAPGFNASDFNTVWNMAYVSVLPNFKDARSKITESMTNVRSIIDISEALVISNLAALFGDIPYSEALQPDLTLTPKYDTPLSVYKAALTLLDNAILDLTTGLDIPISWDIHSYQGNATKWLKFAYSLKARLHIHLGEYSKALNAARNGILALDGSEDFEFLYGGISGQNTNPWHEFSVNRYGYMSADYSNYIDLVFNRLEQDSTNNDTARASYYYTGIGYNDYNTTENGAFGPSSSLAGFKAAETYLIMAEALLMDGNNVDALSNLNLAREYWNQKLGTKLSAYNALNFSNSTELLDEIYIENYLSFNSQIEIFNFLRRIDWDIPGLEPYNKSFVERYLYPESEINSNPNTPVQVADDVYVSLDIFN